MEPRVAARAPQLRPPREVADGNASMGARKIAVREFRSPVFSKLRVTCVRAQPSVKLTMASLSNVEPRPCVNVMSGSAVADSSAGLPPRLAAVDLSREAACAKYCSLEIFSSAKRAFERWSRPGGGRGAGAGPGCTDTVRYNLQLIGIVGVASCTKSVLWIGLTGGASMAARTSGVKGSIANSG